jgi:hypothetical protein
VTHRRVSTSGPRRAEAPGCFFAAPCTENPFKISILPHSAHIAFHAGRRAFVFWGFHFQNGIARGHSLGSVGPMGRPKIAANLLAPSSPARVAAANAIWDRPYGKPEQTTINYNETLDGFTDDEISGFLAALLTLGHTCQGLRPRRVSWALAIIAPGRQGRPEAAGTGRRAVV